LVLLYEMLTSVACSCDSCTAYNWGMAT
jgi:hypothetical protein